jgi:hypothetical protein
MTAWPLRYLFRHVTVRAPRSSDALPAGLGDRSGCQRHGLERPRRAPRSLGGDQRAAPPGGPVRGRPGGLLPPHPQRGARAGSAAHALHRRGVRRSHRTGPSLDRDGDDRGAQPRAPHRDVGPAAPRTRRAHRPCPPGRPQHRAQGRDSAPRPQAQQRPAGRRPGRAHRLRPRVLVGVGQPDEDGPLHGLARLRRPRGGRRREGDPPVRPLVAGRDPVRRAGGPSPVRARERDGDAERAGQRVSPGPAERRRPRARDHRPAGEEPDAAPQPRPRRRPPGAGDGGSPVRAAPDDAALPPAPGGRRRATA